MAYSCRAVERAMKVQEVILRAIDGKLTWVQAADILGYSPRTIRRLRRRLQYYGYDGLLDRRRQLPSPKRAPVAEVQRLLALYRERYLGFNIRHFHQLARREHGVRFCYAFVKKALQTAGLVAKHQPRGRHRRRRSRAPVSASSCISTAVATAGWPCGRRAGSPSSRWSMMRPSGCCTPPCKTASSTSSAWPASPPRSGTAAAASAATIPPATHCEPPELMSFTERPTHGVKQLRPTHVSATTPETTRCHDLCAVGISLRPRGNVGVILFMWLAAVWIGSG